MASTINASTVSGIVQSADTSGVLALQTGGTTAVTVDASQNVGIGTSSPGTKLHVTGSGDTLITVTGGSSSARGIQFLDSSNNGCQIYSTGSNIKFFTEASGVSTERMGINASGQITTPYRPAFGAVCDSGGSKSAGTVLSFATTGGSAQVNYNVGSCWNSSTDRFTAPVAGLYVFNVGIYITNANTAVEGIAPLVNGSELSSGDTFMLYSGNTASTDNQVTGSFTLNLAANDYVQVAVRVGATAITIYSGHTWFQGYLLG